MGRLPAANCTDSKCTNFGIYGGSKSRLRRTMGATELSFYSKFLKTERLQMKFPKKSFSTHRQPANASFSPDGHVIHSKERQQKNA